MWVLVKYTYEVILKSLCYFQETAFFSMLRNNRTLSIIFKHFTYFTYECQKNLWEKTLSTKQFSEIIYLLRLKVDLK